MTTRKTLRKILFIGAAVLPIIVSGSANAMGGAVPTPCDGFGDCIATAWWYVFYR